MADPRFHPASGLQPLAAIAEAGQARLQGDAPDLPGRLFRGVAPLRSAAAEDVAFIENRRHLAALRETRAGAVVLPAALAEALPAGCAGLIAAQPQLAFARIAALFHPFPAARPGRHPSAVVAADAVIGEGCEIGPLAVIGEGVVLGARCIIGAHAVIGPGCVFGDDCRILSQVSVSHCLAGHRVTLHPGARIGQEGFGFVPTPEGRFVTIPQLGRVQLGDDVEVGANSCIDRGALDDTVIGPGTRLDNLVQIGHNVATGRGCVIVSQVGISGSTSLGDYVTIAGQAGLTGHLRIGSRARIGAQAGVQADIPAGQDVTGSPAMPVRDALRASLYLRRLGARHGGDSAAEQKMPPTGRPGRTD